MVLTVSNDGSVSSRPREDTARDSFFRFWGGLVGSNELAHGDNIRAFALETLLREDLALPLPSGVGPVPILGDERALRASVSQYNSHLRESRDRPNILAASGDLDPNETALLVRRRLLSRD